MRPSSPLGRGLTLVAASLALTTCAPTLAVLPAPPAATLTGAAERRTAGVLDEGPQRRPRLTIDDRAAAGDDKVVPPPLPSDDVPARPTEVPRATPPAAAPQPSPRAQATFEPLAVQQPKLRLDGLPAHTDVTDLMAIDGVAFATGITVARTTVVGEEGASEITVAAVDPAGFRVLTPQVTADALAVWERLAEGDAAFTHDAGHRLKLQLGATVPAAEDKALRVGALASNGVPPVADAIVAHETAQRLGVRGERAALVALEPGADARAVAAAVRAAVGVSPAVLEEPRTRRAFITGSAARKAFEPYTYIDNGDGMIQIDPDWVRRNIVRAKVPIFRGEVVCHRLMIDQLRGALQEVVDRGLAHLIDPSQYGGCWVPRHIDWNPSKPLSMHSWGLAVDFNVSTNGLGQVPQMDPRIVEVFDRWGFVWGGRWRRPDGMHFELGALLQSTGG